MQKEPSDTKIISLEQRRQQAAAAKANPVLLDDDTRLAIILQLLNDKPKKAFIQEALEFFKQQLPKKIGLEKIELLKRILTLTAEKETAIWAAEQLVAATNKSLAVGERIENYAIIKDKTFSTLQDTGFVKIWQQKMAALVEETPLVVLSDWVNFSYPGTAEVDMLASALLDRLKTLTEPQQIKAISKTLLACLQRWTLSDWKKKSIAEALAPYMGMVHIPLYDQEEVVAEKSEPPPVENDKTGIEETISWSELVAELEETVSWSELIGEPNTSDHLVDNCTTIGIKYSHPFYQPMISYQLNLETLKITPFSTLPPADTVETVVPGAQTEAETPV